ncbi:hypothetical protein F2Q69_00044716 [Brassica cretica]|uniref:Uncharacterized protein n=1 Tax=Brassica cretica TaxID=69181 RepID=A0A8S9NLY8_BRACR|nr:hypothetical protein F2Q69_00044716 [Brassica cretica]
MGMDYSYNEATTCESANYSDNETTTCESANGSRVLYSLPSRPGFGMKGHRIPLVAN